MVEDRAGASRASSSHALVALVGDHIKVSRADTIHGQVAQVFPTDEAQGSAIEITVPQFPSTMGVNLVRLSSDADLDRIC